MEALIIVVLVILIFSAIAALFFGACFLLNWVLGPPEEDDVEVGRRNIKVTFSCFYFYVNVILTSSIDAIYLTRFG